MLDFPKRPKELQRRLARKRSNAQPPADARRSESSSVSPNRPVGENSPLDTGAPSQRTRPANSSMPQPRMRLPNGPAPRAAQPARDQTRFTAQPAGAPHPLSEPGGNPQRTGAPKQPRPAKRPNRRAAGRRPSHRPDRRAADQESTVRLQQRVVPSTRFKAQPRTTPLVYLVRLLILGVGVGALAGTIISIWNPSLRNPPATQSVEAAKNAQPNSAAGLSPELAANVANVRMGRELTDVVVKVTPLVRSLTDLVPGVFVIDLDSGDFFGFNGSATFSSASMIKMPILIAFFQDVDAGKIKLDEMLSIQQTDVADGSGEMRYAGVGAQYTALEIATNMIINSDNTATNMIIRRIGGIQELNQRFRQWGLQQTMLRKPLPDLEGANTTSPKELVSLMTLLHQGKLVSMKSRDRAFEIMRHTATDTLLPSVLSPGSTIAHKTGDIGSLVGDVGVVDLPSGRRYAIAAMVKRPFNDPRAQDLIRQIAATVYQHFGGQPVIVPSAAPVQTSPGMSPTPAAGSPVGSPAVGTTPAPQQTAPPSAMPPSAMPTPAAPMPTMSPAPAAVNPTLAPAPIAPPDAPTASPNR